jgi:flagellar basal-body rod modification protein FlgD
MTISSATAVGSTTASQSSNIGIQDFLKILTTQLNNQDPLKPVDNQEFVAQIAQFATLEQSRQLNEKIDSMLSVQSATQSIGMLGKTVDVNLGGQTISGKVTAMALQSGAPLLTITTSSGEFQDNISLSQIINIR